MSKKWTSVVFFLANVFLMFSQLVVTCAYWGVVTSRPDLVAVSGNIGKESLMGSKIAETLLTPGWAIAISIVFGISVIKEFLLKNSLQKVGTNIVILLAISLFTGFVLQELYLPIFQN